MKTIIDNMTEAVKTVGELSGDVADIAYLLETKETKGGPGYRESVAESLRFIISARIRDKAAALLELNFELTELTFYLHALHLLEDGAALVARDLADGDDEALARLLDFLKFGDEDEDE